MLENGEEFKAFVEEFIGAHYLRQFKEELIREKEALDDGIDEMIELGKGMILFGNVGVGKTMDLVYIAERIIGIQQKRKVRLIDQYVESVVYENAPVPISYYFMPELFNKLHFGEDIKPERFILFDDWSREYAEPFALSRFEILIEELYAKESSLVITTNLSKNEFIERSGWARVTDRVREMCSTVEIPGQSMRHK